MNEEQSVQTLPPDERARMRKNLIDQAVKLAVSSRWDEAVNVNREVLRLFGEEAESYNRLGKALSEVGQVTEARRCYAAALELDSGNAIAKRNLDRLAGMQDTAAASTAPSQLDTRLFVEETGKSAVARLQAVDPAAVNLLDAGDVVELEAQGNAVNVKDAKGNYIGMLEPRVGLRLAKMMTAGNLYTAAIVSASGEVKVMLRETFQHASQIGRVSFPAARAADFRGYTRRTLVRGQEGDDYDADDDDGDEEAEGWSETGEDMGRPGPAVDIEPEDESFD